VGQIPIPEPCQKGTAQEAAERRKGPRKACFNHSLVPNIVTNTRNRKSGKRGRSTLTSTNIAFPVKALLPGLTRFNEFNGEKKSYKPPGS
jgi:hypothetical protein